MSRIFARCLPFGVSALILSAPVPQDLPGGLLGPGAALAQQAAPTAAEETEAEQPRRRGRRSRDSARGDSAKGDSAKGDSAKGDSAKAGPKAAAGTQQATPVAIFGDWNVFASGEGKNRVCYAIAQPQVRSPKSLKRDTAYLFVTVRKGENIQNEVAVTLGFPVKPSNSQTRPTSGQAASVPAPTDPTINLGPARYGLVVKNENAWLQNPSEEARVVTEMGRTAKLLVKATSLRGSQSTDEYALAGFAEAMKVTREKCR